MSKKKSISSHVANLILKLAKYIVPFVLFVCVAVWLIVFMATTLYIGKHQEIYTIKGTCTNAYYETRRALPIGKSIKTKYYVLCIEVNGQTFCISERTRMTLFESSPPDNQRFVDYCVGKELKIQYMDNEEPHTMLSLSTPNDGTVYLNSDKIRSNNVASLILVSVIFGIGIVFFGTLSIGACIETLKTPPTIKQLRKWHNSRKRQKQLKENKQNE